MKTALVICDKGGGVYFVDVGRFTTFATSDIPLAPGDKVEVKLHGPQGDDAIVVRKLN